MLLPSSRGEIKIVKFQYIPTHYVAARTHNNRMVSNLPDAIRNTKKIFPLRENTLRHVVEGDGRYRRAMTPSALLIEISYTTVGEFRSGVTGFATIYVTGSHRILLTLQWRHNRHDSVSNHQPHDCFLNRLFRRRSKKTPKLRVSGLCAGNSPGTGEFLAQMASNAENVSDCWRHYEVCKDEKDEINLRQKKMVNWTYHWLVYVIISHVTGSCWFVQHLGIAYSVIEHHTYVTLVTNNVQNLNVLRVLLCLVVVSLWINVLMNGYPGTRTIKILFM